MGYELKRKKKRERTKKRAKGRKVDEKFPISSVLVTIILLWIDGW